MSERKKVLIIDDEVDLCLLLKNYLVKKDYDVYIAHTLKDGISKLDSVAPDILFIDNNLPDGLGWDKVNVFIEQYPNLKCNLISAYPTSTPHITVAGRIRWIEKPIALRQIEQYL